MAFIAIDMTPMRPGGENGGAKLVALELLKAFRNMSQDNRFLILTASWNDEELAFLDSSNTKRLCILNKPGRMMHSNGSRYIIQLERILRKIYRVLRHNYREKLQGKGLLSPMGVDVLFCPFTAPTFAEPGIPVVSLIHDLQQKEYPQFFTPRELEMRESFYKEVCVRADAIICISESTRESVIRHLKTDPEKTRTIHNSIQSRLSVRDVSQVSQYLRDLHIDGNPFMFYPANFWPHKNHPMLLTAYGMYVFRNPDRNMDLVLTGTVDNAQRDLQDKVRRMGLERRVHFLGYLSEDQLIAVWKGCSFLIFPSLYEGFGIPVLEAMQFGKPVLCSNVTSLPEVAGDAAPYFDPRKPEEIVQCLEKITGNQELYVDLVKRGYERLSHFQFREMVDKYLQCFEEVIGGPRHFHDEIKGVYRDGWTGKTLDITHSAVFTDGILELTLELPTGVPHKKVAVSSSNHSGRAQKWTIRRGSFCEIRLPLTGTGGHQVFSIGPAFVPSEWSMGMDDRSLGALCKKCRLISSGEERTILWPPKK